MKEKPIQIQLNSLDDLVRWMISSSKNQYGTIFYSLQDNKHIYSSYLYFPNYYELKGLPIHGFTVVEEEPKNLFLRYDVRNDLEEKERLKFTSGFDETESSLGYIQYFPIIKLKNVPDIFTISESKI